MIVTWIAIGVAGTYLSFKVNKAVVKHPKIMPSVKSYLSEKITQSHLKAFKSPQYLLINNLYIPRWNNPKETSEIDHILISMFGIFIIETKDYNATITGSEKQKYWTAQYSNGQEYTTYNPIWQNNSHIKSLKKILSPNYPAIPYYSIINFNSNTRLNVESKVPILYTEDLEGYITQFKEKVLSKHEVAKIYETLTLQNKNSWNTRRVHKKQVEKYIE
jgi:hypothetical protein